MFIMDFKTKFKTMKHRKNAVGNFEKRGLSWNGTLDLYYIIVYVKHDTFNMKQ